MAVSQFSEDGKYFAYLDGKLKIWDTVSNTFEQEFTPDFHLTSPCISLHFVDRDSGPPKGASPRKKKRKSISNPTPNIILGTTSGSLLVYSITKASVEEVIKSDINQPVKCLSSNNDHYVYSGVGNNIAIWNIQKKLLELKWSAGNENLSAILVLPYGTKLLTASKQIKLWNIHRREVIKTFTGHSSEVCLLKYINPKNSLEDSYFISGSKGDHLLNCWNLKEDSDGKQVVASFLMEGTVTGLSVLTEPAGSTNMAAVSNGKVHLFQHTLNGHCVKPLKPKTTIQVVDDTSKDEKITPIVIMSAFLRDCETLCIGYGELVQFFENISITNVQKQHCLLRKDPQKVASSTQDKVSKVKTPVVGNDVHYLAPQTSGVSKRKGGEREVPMETRLENLTLNKTADLVPKSTNVAQLLVQGLHSKDKGILRTVLRRKDENVIRNTIRRLPITVIIPLIEELSQNYIGGKTETSQIGVLWLKNLIAIHAGLLVSNPELADLLKTVLGSIELRLSLLTPLNRLRGRLNLLVAQFDAATAQNGNEDPLLVFNDREEGSESEVDPIEVEEQSDSENEWSEASSDAENNEVLISDHNNSEDDEVMSS